MPFVRYPHSLLRSKTWRAQVSFCNQHVRYYYNEDFMVIKHGRMDFYHRSTLQRLVWAGPPYRSRPLTVLRIPLYITDDFGNLVQVGKK